MNYLRPELLDQLASAYVLGTLRGPARRRFERLCRESQAVRLAVQAWEVKLTPLAVSVPATTPSPALWSRIARQLGHVEARSSRDWWRFLAPTVSFAFGLVMAVGLLQMSPGLLPRTEKAAPSAEVAKTVVPPSYVGLLLDKDGVPAILASSLRHGRTLSIKFLQKIEIPEGKFARVWAIAPNQPARLLGTLNGQALKFEMSGTSEELLSTTKQLAVSIDDRDATPTEPASYVFIGHCVKLW